MTNVIRRGLDSASALVIFCCLALCNVSAAQILPDIISTDTLVVAVTSMTTFLSDNPLDILEEETSRTQHQQLATERLTTQSQYKDELNAPATTEPLTSGIDLQTTDSRGNTRTLTLIEKMVEVTNEPIVANSTTGFDTLPTMLDKSTTNAQLRQLRHCEERGQIGEAFLIAREMVRQFQTDEFAYDAAIRNSLILGKGMESATEELFKQAMVMVDYPGKYYVEFAHMLLRRGAIDRFHALYEEYKEMRADDVECTLTLSRMAALAGDNVRVIANLAPLRNNESTPLDFPMFQLLFNAYVQNNQPDEARILSIEAMDLDLGPWEKRSVFTEFLKLPGIEPDEVIVLLRQVLSNEQDYRTAKAIATKVIEQSLAQRFFEPLENRLKERIEREEANHIEIWMAALMAQKKHRTDEVRQLLLEATKSTTPVVAFERAMFYLQEGNTTSSMEILQDLLEDQWHNTDIRLQLVELYLQTNKPIEAAELLDDMTPVWVDRNVMRKVGVLAIKVAMRMDNAQYLMDTWVSQSSIAQFSDLLTMGDQVIAEIGAPERADELLHLVDERLQQPNQWSLYLLRARLNTLKGDQRAALESYLRYLDHDYNNILMTQFVANLAAQTATTRLQLTENTNDKNTVVSIIPVRAINTNNTDIAIDLYQRLIKMQPMVMEHYSALMRVYQSRGEVRSAMTVALNLADDNTSAADRMTAMAAKLLSENGFAKDSIPLYEKALQKNRFDFSLWFNYAQALADAGRYKDAIAIYHNFLLKGVSGHAVNQPGILANLQAIAKKTNKNNELVDFLVEQRNVSLPGKPEFLLSSAKLLMQLERMDMATTMIAAFREQYPHHHLAADSLLLLGQVAEAKGRPDHAMALFQSVATSTETLGTTAEIRARFEIGELKRKQGDHNGAIEAWVDLKSRYPNDNKAIEGLYEAAMLAWFELKDNAWALGLLNDFLDSGSTDLEMAERAQRAHDALTRKMTAEEFQKSKMQVTSNTE